MTTSLDLDAIDAAARDLLMTDPSTTLKLVEEVRRLRGLLRPQLERSVAGGLSPNAARRMLYGMFVEPSDALPPGEIEFRDPVTGHVIGTVTNIGDAK